MATMLAIRTVPEQASFSMKAACKYLGLDAKTVRKYADLGYLKAYRRDRIRYFCIEDLDSFRKSEFDSRSERPVKTWKGM